MQEIKSLLSACMRCFSRLTKKAYAKSAVIAVGLVIVAVVSLNDKGFGGAGKNNLKNSAIASTKITVDEEDEESVLAYIDNSVANAQTTLDEEAQLLVTEGLINRDVILTQGGATSEQDTEVAIETTGGTEDEAMELSIAIEPVFKGQVANKLNIDISEADYQSLLTIVEAEATCEDLKGRILVANVVINRVYSKNFPNSIYDVIHQAGQFSPLRDGRYYTVKVSNLTREAVDQVLQGVDYSEGALYFAARSMAKPKSMKWFDSALEFVLKHGVHEFFK